MPNDPLLSLMGIKKQKYNLWEPREALEATLFM